MNQISKNNRNNRSDNSNVLDISRENTTPMNYKIYIQVYKVYLCK